MLLILSVGLFYAFTNDQYQDVKQLYALASEYKSVLRNISEIVEFRDRLRVTYEALPKEEIERINKVLPDNIDTVRLALDLDSMASRYGISIKSIKTETGATRGANTVVLPEDGEVYESATVALSFVSNYENFKRLMADIEKNLRIMNIKSISFQTSDNGLYNYEISAETYWLK